MKAGWQWLIVLVLLVLYCSDYSSVDNLPPTAVLNLPANGQVGQSVLLDGSQSSDADGDHLQNFHFHLFPQTGILATITDAVNIDLHEEYITQSSFYYYTFQVAGAYNVVLVVYDPYGESDAATAAIMVH